MLTEVFQERVSAENVLFGKHCLNIEKGAQWLSGRVLDSRLRGRGFEPHRHHCVVSLSKTHLSLFSTGSTQDDPSLYN